MNNSSVIVSSEILNSAINEDDTSLTAKFYICDFSVNGNNVMLNRKTIDNWVSTLVNQPVLAKLGINDDGTADFEGHNMQIVNRVDDNGNVYQATSFDTSALGTFISAGIENIGGKDCITATAKIWKRFPEFCAVLLKRLDEGTLSTSWEINVFKSHYEMINSQKVKVIDDGSFIGHTLLNAHFPPAYKDSQLLEVATVNQSDNDLIDALSKDLSIVESSNISISNNSNKKEDDNLKDKEEEMIAPEGQTTQSTEDEDIKAEDISEDKTDDVDTTQCKEKAELTDNDVREELYDAISEKLNICMWDFTILCNIVTTNTCWVQLWNSESELDILVFTYTIENDEVTVSDPVPAKLTVSVTNINDTIEELTRTIDSQKDSLVEASVKIQELSTQVSNLMPFKESFDQAEQIKMEAETSAKREILKTKAIKSGLITEDELVNSEEIKNCIENLDETTFKSIIAERFMKSLDEKTVDISTIETSEKKQVTEISQLQGKSNISDDGSEDIVDKKAIMKKFLSK